MANKPITSQPDSMNPSAPVNSAPNAPAAAMSQDAYSASVENQMMDRRHKMRKHGARNGKPYPQNEQ
jgi:hypothetical protein